MKKYRVLAPMFLPAGPVWFQVSWKVLHHVNASSNEDAIAKAKKLKVLSPIVQEIKSDEHELDRVIFGRAHCDDRGYRLLQ